MSSGTRILYLDGIPQGTFKNVRLIGEREHVEELYAEIYRLEKGPEVTLDCRSLSTRHYGLLLKFLEEYKGKVVMFARDPVPAPILSRFTETKKIFTPTPGKLISLRFKHLPMSIKGKVATLFGLSVDREEDEHTQT